MPCNKMHCRTCRNSAAHAAFQMQQIEPGALQMCCCIILVSELHVVRTRPTDADAVHLMHQIQILESTAH